MHRMDSKKRGRPRLDAKTVALIDDRLRQGADPKAIAIEADVSLTTVYAQRRLLIAAGSMKESAA